MIRLAVFDAYGTLFDVAGAARAAAAAPGGAAIAALWPRLAEDWRRKQLEYSWLRAITGDHADFARVTADALDWAMAAHGLTDPALRARLLALYDALPAFPEVADTLETLRAQGLARAILSNGSPAMLDAATRAAGLADRFDAVLSVEAAGIFKPSARVYALVGDRFGTAPGEGLFVSSNGWDVAGAARAGFVTVWVNRAGLPQDRLPHGPAHILPDLSGLPDLLRGMR
jgi:2-haloacid dehalogenase